MPWRKSKWLKKAASAALLVSGLILVFFGVTATNSFSSEVSRFFTGSPTDKAVWMLITGSVAIILGLALTFRRAR